MLKPKNVVFVVVVWLLVALVILLGFESARQPVRYRINPNKPMVALTFDDGPNPEFTPQILDILYENRAAATFFINGKNIECNDFLLGRMIQEGHELANHTYSHPDLTLLSAEQIEREVSKTQAELEALFPGYTLNYVRPPYSRYNGTVLAAVEQPLVLWDLDSGDWVDPDAQAIYTTVIENVKDGDVVIFHDDNQQTVEALRRLVPALFRLGYQMVTLAQLEEHRGLDTIC